MLKNCLGMMMLSAVLANVCQAGEIRAITEDGRKVILSEDGRWKFSNQQAPSAASGETAQSPYKTLVPRFSVAFNTAKWAMAPRRENDEPNKQVFRHKSAPLYAMVIADEIPVAPETLKRAIIGNAKSAGADLKVLLDQKLTLGGSNIGELRFITAVSGIEFVYDTYYYGDGGGNFQVTCFTSQAVFFKYEAECQQFLSGMTVR